MNTTASEAKVAGAEVINAFAEPAISLSNEDVEFYLAAANALPSREAAMTYLRDSAAVARVNWEALHDFMAE